MTCQGDGQGRGNMGLVVVIKQNALTRQIGCSTLLFGFVMLRRFTLKVRGYEERYDFGLRTVQNGHEPMISRLLFIYHLICSRINTCFNRDHINLSKSTAIMAKSTRD